MQRWCKGGAEGVHRWFRVGAMCTCAHMQTCRCADMETWICSDMQRCRCAVEQMCHKVQMFRGGDVQRCRFEVCRVSEVQVQGADVEMCRNADV